MVAFEDSAIPSNGVLQELVRDSDTEPGRHVRQSNVEESPRSAERYLMIDLRPVVIWRITRHFEFSHS